MDYTNVFVLEGSFETKGYMCMLAILYRVARNTPILVAANREEFFARPTQYPKIQSGTPRVVCGTDRQAGGTWLGVNQYGLLVAVTNRPKSRRCRWRRRSRGLLCRDLLDLRTAREAAEHAPQGNGDRPVRRRQLPLCRREVRGGGLRRQSRRGGRADAGTAHAQQRQPGRHAATSGTSSSAAC